MKLYWSPKTRAVRAIWMLEETGVSGLEDQEWIIGDFSAADVMLGSSVVFLRSFEMLPESPGLDAYADRCLARPAYRKALEIGS